MNSKKQCTAKCTAESVC